MFVCLFVYLFVCVIVYPNLCLCGVGYVSSDVFTEIHVWEHDLAPDGSVARLQELTEFVEISNCIHEDRDDTASE